MTIMSMQIFIRISCFLAVVSITSFLSSSRVDSIKFRSNRSAGIPLNAGEDPARSEVSEKRNSSFLIAGVTRSTSVFLAEWIGGQVIDVTTVTKTLATVPTTPLVFAVEHPLAAIQELLVDRKYRMYLAKQFSLRSAPPIIHAMEIYQLAARHIHARAKAVVRVDMRVDMDDLDLFLTGAERKAEEAEVLMNDSAAATSLLRYRNYAAFAGPPSVRQTATGKAVRVEKKLRGRKPVVHPLVDAPLTWKVLMAFNPRLHDGLYELALAFGYAKDFNPWALSSADHPTTAISYFVPSRPIIPVAEGMVDKDDQDDQDQDGNINVIDDATFDNGFEVVILDSKNYNGNGNNINKRGRNNNVFGYKTDQTDPDGDGNGDNGDALLSQAESLIGDDIAQILDIADVGIKSPKKDSTNSNSNNNNNGNNKNGEAKNKEGPIAGRGTSKSSGKLTPENVNVVPYNDQTKVEHNCLFHVYLSPETWFPYICNLIAMLGPRCHCIATDLKAAELDGFVLRNKLRKLTKVKRGLLLLRPNEWQRLVDNYGGQLNGLQHVLYIIGDEFCETMGLYRPERTFIIRNYFDSRVLDRDSNVFWFPLGTRHVFVPPSRTVLPVAERPYYANFLGALDTSTSRVEAVQAIGRSKILTEKMYVRAIDSWSRDFSGYEDPEVYSDKLMKSRFTVSPFGHHPECYRLYEAVELGSIPLVQDSCCDFPVDPAQRELTPALMEKLANKSIHRFNQPLSRCMGEPFFMLKRLDAPFVYIYNWSHIEEIIVSHVDEPVRLQEHQTRLIQWYEQLTLTYARMLFELLQSDRVVLSGSNPV